MPVTLEDLDDDEVSKSMTRFSFRRSSINKVLRNLGKHHVVNLDSPSRNRLYINRESAINADVKSQEITTGHNVGYQRMIGKADNILSIEFLELGSIAAHSIGRVDTELGAGSGFLISPELFMTNHHVLRSKKLAENVVIEMFDEENRLNEPLAPEQIFLDPNRFFVTNKDLDFTIVAIKEGTDTSPFGWLPLLKEQGKILIGHPVNIIQHPDAGLKKVVVHHSNLIDVTNIGATQNFCWYTGDTREGSSGSPVFSNRWEVIALHHRAVPKTNRHNQVLDIYGKTMTKERYVRENHLVHWLANEGTRTSRIVQAFSERQFSNKNHTALCKRTLELWRNSRSRVLGKKTGYFDNTNVQGQLQNQPRDHLVDYLGG